VYLPDGLINPFFADHRGTGSTGIADRVKSEGRRKKRRRVRQLQRHLAQGAGRHLHGVGNAGVIKHHPVTAQQVGKFILYRLVCLQHDQTDPRPASQPVICGEIECFDSIVALGQGRLLSCGAVALRHIRPFLLRKERRCIGYSR